MDDSEPKVTVLDCGCITMDGGLCSPCFYHWDNQPKFGDPLDNFLKRKDEEYLKRNNEEE